ncbi:MAG: cohesin domain-containing protein [Dehalococcoidia bacterium]|nr:cohesin domain-containing protein [Dehalococcoidia bacterium]
MCRGIISSKLIRLIAIFVIFLSVAGLSPYVAKAQQTGSVVDLALTPATRSINAGTSFDIVIQAQPNEQDVVGVDVYLDFNPAHLEIVSIAQGTTLNQMLQKTYDNTAGTLGYSAGTVAQPFPTTNFTIATVTFKAKNVSVSTVIAFYREPPRESLVTSGTAPVLRNTIGAAATILVPGQPTPSPATPPTGSPEPSPTPAPAPTPTQSPKPTATTPPTAPAPAPAPAQSPAPAPKPSPSPSPAITQAAKPSQTATASPSPTAKAEADSSEEGLN